MQHVLPCLDDHRHGRQMYHTQTDGRKLYFHLGSFTHQEDTVCLIDLTAGRRLFLTKYPGYRDA